MSLALAAVPARARDQSWRQFDLSGLPARPTTFEEQSLLESARSPAAADRRQAARIQRALASYYRAHGDAERSRVAEARAAAAEQEQMELPRLRRAAAKKPPRARLAAPAGRSGFSGRFYGMSGRTLNTWDFNPDGTFYHATIASGAGTSVRNSERGSFEVHGAWMILRVQNTAGGFVTPGAGRSVQLGGAAASSASLRRLSLRKLPHASGAILLGGERLKVKSW